MKLFKQNYFKIFFKATGYAVVIAMVINQFAFFTVLAQESPTEIPTPTGQAQTPTETPTQAPDPSPTDYPSSDPSPTPTMLIEQTNETITENQYPSPTPEESTLDEANSNNTTNNIESISNTGNDMIENITETPTPMPEVILENTQISDISEPTPTPDLTLYTQDSEATPEALIISGDALTINQISNNINTTSINSDVVGQTQNVTGVQNTSIDLSGNTQSIPNDFGQNYEGNDKGSALATNSAVITNNIYSDANTGNNLVENSSSAAIITGNAETMTSLDNFVNTVIIDSTLKIFTINIFGTLNGNIILPDFPESSLICCGQSIDLKNTANITNNILAYANSGYNLLVASGGGVLETGNAINLINILNLVNSAFIDSGIQYLAINTYGSWDGQYVGWGNITNDQIGGNYVTTNNSDTSSQSCALCIDSLAINNNANVVNNIISTANTGNNTQLSQNGIIKTGNAVNMINITNIVNSAFFNSIGYFAFINIFGSLHGHIGGAKEIAKLSEPDVTATPSPTPNLSDMNNDDQSDTLSSDQMESGGLLNITLRNNVGEYVLPGDTVTFFITIKNPGPGIVYNSNVTITLVSNGYNYGNVTIPIGNIKAFGGLKISTGLVLSPESTAGSYQASAKATGFIGPDNHQISDNSYNDFLIGGKQNIAYTEDNSSLVSLSTIDKPEVKGDSTSKTSNDKKMTSLLYLCIGTFLSIQTVKRRKEILLSAYHMRLFL
jgi:hypothetical protein